jgi:hypothetical protein
MLEALIREMSHEDAVRLFVRLLGRIQCLEDHVSILEAQVEEGHRVWDEVVELRPLKERYAELERANAAVIERMRKAEAVALAPMNEVDANVIRAAVQYVLDCNNGPGSAGMDAWVDLKVSVDKWRASDG